MRDKFRYKKDRRGDYTGIVPPDPFPNSEVKDTKAHDSVVQRMARK